MNALLDIISVKPQEGGRMSLVFENGERRVYDMSRLFVQRPYNVLQDPVVFNRAYVENGTVNWPGDIDIDPETLWEDSVKI